MEATKVAAEAARVKAEAAKVKAEAAKVKAEGAKVKAEGAKVNTEAARVKDDGEAGQSVVQERTATADKDVGGIAVDQGMRSTILPVQETSAHEDGMAL